MLSSLFMYAGLAALVLLALANRFRPASPARVALMCGAMSSAFGLALFAKTFEVLAGGGTFAFGRVYAYLSRAETPFKYWAYVALLVAAGVGSCFAGIYLVCMMFKRPTARDQVGAFLSSETIRDALFANGTNIKADYTGYDFYSDARRVALVAHAQHQLGADPEYAKTIFAAALFNYGRFPASATADGFTIDDMTEMANDLFAMESKDPGTPGRADYRYRMLLQYGPVDAGWREQALEALVGNAGLLLDNEKVALALRCAVFNAKPGSALYGSALRQLDAVFGAFQESDAAGAWDHRGTKLACFIAQTNHLASAGAPESERNGVLAVVPDHQVSHMARAQFWKWVAACVARRDELRHQALLLAAMNDGSADLAREAMEALCNIFGKLVSAAPTVAESTVRHIYGRSTFAFPGSRKSRNAVFGECLARILPILQVADPEAALRARRDGYEGSESWR